MSLIISWPGQFQQGMHSNALVELIDIVSTLLELAGLAGLDVPGDLQGTSRLPILTGESALDRRRDFVRCEYHDALNLPNASHANIIFDGHYKLVVYYGTGVGELFDMEADPHKFDNLWDNTEAREIKQELLMRRPLV